MAKEKKTKEDKIGILFRVSNQTKVDFDVLLGKLQESKQTFLHRWLLKAIEAENKSLENQKKADKK